MTIAPLLRRLLPLLLLLLPLPAYAYVDPLDALQNQFTPPVSSAPTAVSSASSSRKPVILPPAPLPPAVVVTPAPQPPIEPPPQIVVPGEPLHGGAPALPPASPAPLIGSGMGTWLAVAAVVASAAWTIWSARRRDA